MGLQIANDTSETNFSKGWLRELSKDPGMEGLLGSRVVPEGRLEERAD